MTAFLALLPAVLLIGGAFVYWLTFFLPQRYRNFIPVAVCLLAAAGIIVSARASVDAVNVFEPSDVLPALSLTVQWSGIALPLGILLVLLVAGRLTLRPAEESRSLVGGSLIATAGALLWLAADNWTAIAAAWVVVELGLLPIAVNNPMDRDAPARALAWNLAAIVAWLTAGLILANAGSSLRLGQAAIQNTAGLLVFLAIWIRTGLYPFHAAAPADGDTLGVRLGIPLALGGYLMTRLLTQTTGVMQADTLAAILAVVAVGASALLVVAQPHGTESFVWTIRALGAPLLLLPFLIGGQAAPALALGLAVGSAAAANVVGLALLWRAQLPGLALTAVVWAAALITVGMLPLSPGFWSRAGLLAEAYAQARLPVWLMLVAALSLALLPVWREIFASRDIAPKAPTRFEYLALALVLVPTVIAGVMAFLFTNPLGAPVQQGAEQANAAVFAPRNPATLIFTAAGLVVPLLASLELARRWDRRANLAPMVMTDLLDLSLLARALDWVYGLVRLLVQQCMAILEQPPIPWLIFLAIWVAVWLNGL